ncbi:hypothetical protein GCM10027028_65060 [Streptomyces sundarbansensis]
MLVGVEEAGEVKVLAASGPAALLTGVQDALASTPASTGSTVPRGRIGASSTEEQQPPWPVPWAGTDRELSRPRAEQPASRIMDDRARRSFPDLSDVVLGVRRLLQNPRTA